RSAHRLRLGGGVRRNGRREVRQNQGAPPDACRREAGVAIRRRHESDDEAAERRDADAERRAGNRSAEKIRRSLQGATDAAERTTGRGSDAEIRERRRDGGSRIAARKMPSTSSCELHRQAVFGGLVDIKKAPESASAP